MNMESKHYRRLAAMSVLSFAAMYALMYAMVDEFGNVYSNVNQFYMAALMAAPMVIIELVVMRDMYGDQRRNRVILVVAALVLGGSFLLIRMQLGVSDKQFLRSMIPHHAGAILMCERASLKDPEVAKLCGAIISSQRSEIAQMRAKLEALDQ